MAEFVNLRTRHEHQIKRYDRYAAITPYERAIKTLIREHGLHWLADDQIADIRANLINAEWSRYSFRRDQRKERAAA